MLPFDTPQSPRFHLKIVAKEAADSRSNEFSIEKKKRKKKRIEIGVLLCEHRATVRMACVAKDKMGQKARRVSQAPLKPEQQNYHIDVISLSVSNVKADETQWSWPGHLDWV